MFCCLYLTGRLHVSHRLLVTDNEALRVIHILFFDFLLALCYSTDISITVLDLLPHIKKFDYLNSKVARQKCLILIRAELKKSRRKKSNF